MRSIAAIIIAVVVAASAPSCLAFAPTGSNRAVFGVTRSTSSTVGSAGSTREQLVLYASKLTKNVIAIFEGLNKDTASDIPLHEVLFNNDSMLKWNWLEEPLDAKGAAGIAEVHKDWFSTFPDLKRDECTCTERRLGKVQSNLTFLTPQYLSLPSVFYIIRVLVFPQLVFKDVIEDGPDRCACRFVVSMTSLTTGEKIDSESGLFMTGKDGKLVEGTWLFDTTFVMINGKKSKFALKEE
eukprot:scaffold86288_cov39-Attheya_sp.AAC.4